MADIRNDDLEDILAGMLDEQDPVPSRSLPHPGISPPRVPRVLPSGPMNLSSPHAVPPPHRPIRPRPAP